jgi:hypothetical protein
LPDYELKFTHPQLAGITVTMGRLNIAQTFEFEDIVIMPRTTRDERVAYSAAMAAFVGKHIVGWNLTDRDGKEVPVGEPTDGLLLAFIRDGWLQGLSGGDAPSPLGEDGPDDEFEAEIPVQPLPGPSDAESETAG